ncbi:hypothetical protein ACJIZ3_022752 [Penstemon smallii]|uniref:CCHC-type domain-containing protein n=1 Tax=Penstemon smallii TaxID=265156 RepID=A0ABD3TM47_9LAMI
MSLRSSHINSLPPPNYHCDGSIATLRIYHGGSLIHNPEAVYVGGKVNCFDYIYLESFSLSSIDKMVENLGYVGFRRYYRLEEKAWMIVQDQDDLVRKMVNNEMVMYLDTNLDTPTTQIGSSNPKIGCQKLEVNLENENTVLEVSDHEAFDSEESEEEVVHSDSFSNSDSETDTEEEMVEEGYTKECLIYRQCDNPNFTLEMIFRNKKEFKDAVNVHAVATRRNITITKNDNRRVYAKCAEEDCDWRIHALKMKDECTFQIREYNPVHKCGRAVQSKNANSKWLAQMYEDKFRTDPNTTVDGFRNDVMKDISMNISKHQAYRAKRKALAAIEANNKALVVFEGNPDEQYKQLQDYAEESRKSNPGSSVIMTQTDGRPKKARRMGADEPVSQKKKGVKGKKGAIKLKRLPYKVKCRFCGQTGHNRKGCEMRKMAENCIADDNEENAVNDNDVLTLTYFVDASKDCPNDTGPAQKKTS